MPINFNQVYNQAVSAASDAADAASDVVNSAADAVQGAAEAVGGAAESAGDAAQETAENAGSAVQGAAGTVGSAVSGAIGTVGSTVKGAVQSVGSAVNGAVGTVGSAVKGAVGTVGSAVSGAVQTVGSAVRGAVNTTGKAVAGAVDGAIDMGTNTVQGINRFADDVKTGTTDWVAGSMEDAGIDMPQDLSGRSLFNTGQSILDVTAANIHDKASRLTGQDTAALADKAAQVVSKSPKENWDDMKKDIREPLTPVAETLKKVGEAVVEKAQDQVDHGKKKTKG